MRRHWLNSGLAALGAIIDGGIVRGRISEIIGPIGFGCTRSQPVMYPRQPEPAKLSRGSKAHVVLITPISLRAVRV